MLGLGRVTCAGPLGATAGLAHPESADVDLRDDLVAPVEAALSSYVRGGERIEAAAQAPYVALTTIDDAYPERPDR